MLLRILLFVILGYILIKTVRFLVNIFTAVKAGKEDQKVYTNSKTKSKIDKKDVIEAEFEEIESRDKNSNEN